jgi:hypothetical protein
LESSAGFEGIGAFQGLPASKGVPGEVAPPVLDELVLVEVLVEVVLDEVVVEEVVLAEVTLLVERDVVTIVLVAALVHEALVVLEVPGSVA